MHKNLTNYQRTEEESQRREMDGAADIGRLPEECISHMLSLTSPRDSCRSAAVSAAFRSAATSDAVWERFLPPSILSRAIDLQSFASKKDLFFHLCDHPILIDGGRKSFWLERERGAKCFEIGARDLTIIWSSDSRYWAWDSSPDWDDSQFAEVARLLDVCWLDITGRIDSRELTQKTQYTSYVVFKLDQSAYGLSTPVQEASVAVGTAAHSALRQVCLHQVYAAIDEAVHLPSYREDGWMEIELGEFFIEGGDDGEVVMKLAEINVLNWKRGLIVRGFQVRPKVL